MAKREIGPEKKLRRAIAKEARFLVELADLEREPPVPIAVFVLQVTKILTAANRLVAHRSGEAAETLKSLRRSIRDASEN